MWVSPSAVREPVAQADMRTDLQTSGSLMPIAAWAAGLCKTKPMWVRLASATPPVTICTTVADKGDIARSASYGGYLSGDFFHQYDVELDFAGKQVNWLTPVSCTDPNQVVFWAHSAVAIIPVSLAPDGRYQMQATVRGHAINAEIDTSSPHTVMRRDIADRFVGLTAGKDMAPLGDSKDGMGMQIYVSNFPQITFAGGGVTAENVPVLIQDFSMIPALFRHVNMLTRAPTEERIPDLAIGMDVLQQLHMYFVPGQSRIYVTSAE